MGSRPTRGLILSRSVMLHCYINTPSGAHAVPSTQLAALFARHMDLDWIVDNGVLETTLPFLVRGVPN